MPLDTPDREFLEQRIFPFLNARAAAVLILGYNDNASHLDFAVRDVEEYRGFEEFVPAIDLVTAATMKVNPANDHTFVFLKRGPLR